MTFIEKSQELDYNNFCSYIDMYYNNPTLTESLINEGLFSDIKDKISFIKELALKLSLDFEKIIILFKEKYLFNFFSKLKWSISKFVDVIKQGYKAYTALHSVISQYLAEQKIFKLTEEVIKKLEIFLIKHPRIKPIAGIVLAGFLAFQWTSLISFTGDVDFDFDQTALFQALSGNFSLVDILAGESGAKLLLFIATNVISGITFPWPGETWVLFAFSIIYTVAKYKYPQVAQKMKPLLQKVSSLKKIKE